MLHLLGQLNTPQTLSCNTQHHESTTDTTQASLGDGFSHTFKCVIFRYLFFHTGQSAQSIPFYLSVIKLVSIYKVSILAHLQGESLTKWSVFPVFITNVRISNVDCPVMKSSCLSYQLCNFTTNEPFSKQKLILSWGNLCTVAEISDGY